MQKKHIIRAHQLFYWTMSTVITIVAPTVLNFLKKKKHMIVAISREYR
jgi:hypothetical protein